MSYVNENNNLLPPASPNEEENIVPGKFDYIKDNSTRVMLINAWQAISITETWNFVKEDIDSFMFSDNPIVKIIYNKMEELGYCGHSGSSFGFTMRTMQFIATYGEKKYREQLLSSH
jgi:hypothetical protein